MQKMLIAPAYLQANSFRNIGVLKNRPKEDAPVISKEFNF